MKKKHIFIYLIIFIFSGIILRLSVSKNNVPSDCYGRLTQNYGKKKLAVLITLEFLQKNKTGKLNVSGNYQDENGLNLYISRQVSFNYEEINDKLIATSESVSIKPNDTMDNTWLGLFFADFLMRENRGIVLDNYQTINGDIVYLSDGIPALYCNKMH
ncbi:hypothetical protein EYY95_06090 [Hafnia alvei]|uniref:hypothetical protein n=1 Tax=Hafnia alvei TaxID=569 RepID=UPI0010330E6E|nr:hypothetical protein [Hafnia alvei]TBL89934.1 hypothetical protein EYY95_06090 [Hafnia alvei]